MELSQQDVHKIRDAAYRQVGGDDLVAYVHQCAILRTCPTKEKMLELTTAFLQNNSQIDKSDA